MIHYLENMVLIIILAILVLSISLIGLVFSSRMIIIAVEKVMEMTKISETGAGFVILAVISSIAEIVVAIFAVMENTVGITIGDIFGSHLFNIGIVLGVIIILGYCKERHSKTLVEINDILFIASIIPLLLLLAHFQEYEITGSPFIGVILIIIYFLSIIFILKKQRTDVKKGETHPFIQFDNEGNNITMIDQLPIRKIRKEFTRKQKTIIILKILIGGGIIILSGRLIITSAITIMYAFTIFPIIIGAKIIAIATSLPELSFCYIAAKKGKINLALGDALGANLTTGTFVLGIVLVLAPFKVNLVFFTEIIVFVIIMNLVLWRFLNKGGIAPYQGFILLFIYIIFQALI